MVIPPEHTVRIVAGLMSFAGWVELNKSVFPAKSCSGSMRLLDCAIGAAEFS